MIEGFAFVHFGLQEPLEVGGAPGDGSDQAVDHAAEVLADLWRHAVYGRLPV